MNTQGGKKPTIEDIIAALKRHDGVTKLAAEELGITTGTLGYYVRKYPDVRAVAKSRKAAKLKKEDQEREKEEQQKETAQGKKPKAETPKKRKLSIALAEEKLLELIEAGDKNAIMFYLSTKGKNQGYAPARPLAVTTMIKERKKARSILKKLLDQKISVFDAALEFEMAGIALPETLRAMLSKAEQPNNDPTDGYSLFTDKDLQERLEERSRELQKQFEGLEQRRAEIQKLRESVADSFNQADMEKG